MYASKSVFNTATAGARAAILDIQFKLIKPEVEAHSYKLVPGHAIFPLAPKNFCFDVIRVCAPQRRLLKPGRSPRLRLVVLVLALPHWGRPDLWPMMCEVYSPTATSSSTCEESLTLSDVGTGTRLRVSLIRSKSRWISAALKSVITVGPKCCLEWVILAVAQSAS
ncbi:hypothetical protein RRG08_029312 [Elysia crispata]|uniref:Uncharacterized protein n=1 Tax=Elysia crispata TaxID=231223 RepID=A0AAE1DTE4_9GAST|nr:hypothetical protein RRG08_029312 [Elysia crispata]